jgi:Putative beta-barrel porin-2, OmpL-like. bbp2
MKYASLAQKIVSAILLTLPTTVYSAPLAFPAMGGTLTGNQKPIVVSAGPVGDIHVGGVISGLGYAQTNAESNDKKSNLDFSNGQVFVQKNTGLVQFYAQAGGYTFSTLGLPYMDSQDTTESQYGIVPVAYATLAPTDNFSISVGKLPTLIGYEYGFTFQNANIQRGLLWGQENVVNKGIQANFTEGAFSAAVSWNDGFYSNDFNWVSALLTYKINDNNTVSFSGGGNLDKTNESSAHTPMAQNNSDIYSLIYTYTKDKWSFAPYVQYTFVHQQKALGLSDNASTLGGALIATYRYNDTISFAGRGEYITSNGNQDLTGYGNESDAWSLTFTPTYQKDSFFARTEFSYVGVNDETTGTVFGKNGTREDQARGLLEVGFIF